jgi:hypothetical protein
MINNETLLNNIKEAKDLKVKQQLILEYIKLIRVTVVQKKKLSLEVVRMNSVSKLDFFIYNLFLVGEGNKKIG